MSTYQANIPTGTVNLDVDYQNLQKNFQQLDVTFGTDHTTVSDNTAENGFHKSIHFIPQATPTNDPGNAQLYTTTTSDGINTDQQLFYQTGTGNYDVALTRNFEPVNSANGVSFIAGGLIIKWGSATVANGGTINFETTAPFSNVFSIVPSITSALNAREMIGIVSQSNTGFVVNLQSTIGPTGSRLVQYVAIGN